jgi:hypothetical protein
VAILGFPSIVEVCCVGLVLIERILSSKGNKRGGAPLMGGGFVVFVVLGRSGDAKVPRFCAHIARRPCCARRARTNTIVAILGFLSIVAAS